MLCDVFPFLGVYVIVAHGFLSSKMVVTREMRVVWQIRVMLLDLRDLASDFLGKKPGQELVGG